MQSQIQRYFAGKKVFLTGSTGFLGKVVLEKLLRTCWDVDRIWLLVRNKEGLEPTERLRQMFEVSAFHPLKMQRPDFLNKVATFAGDCEVPNLGLASNDLKTLKQDIDVIIHCAATVRFNEKLRKATDLNVRAVRYLVNIAKEMKQLNSFVHVSTAYSNCVRKNIDEIFYEPGLNEDKLDHLVEAFDDTVLDAVTPSIIGKWPNTYTFTKAVAEDIIRNERHNLPISIVRPSIVIASAKEPEPGWVDNFTGGNRLVGSIASGAMKTFPLATTKVADLIPVDYVANAVLAAAWGTGEKNTVEEDQIIYNCVSGSQNPITWGDMTDFIDKYAPIIKASQSKRHIFFPAQNKHIFLVFEFLLHIVPAYMNDFLLFCMGKKPKFVVIYKKNVVFTKISSYFGVRDWNYGTENLQKLWNRMNAKDKVLFDFDVRKVDWDKYFLSFIRGIKVHLYKEPHATTRQAENEKF